MNPPNPVPEPSIDTCLRRDQHRLRRERDRLRAGKMRGNDIAAAETALAQKIAASTAARAARAASVPKVSYPEELPISANRDEIRRAIEKHAVVILCGETGSGKTTQLPKICLEAGRGVAGVIGHTQPRRIAARAVASRIAEEMNTPLGQLVGYKLRFQDHSRPEGLIKLMTDGILLAETQGDRYLDAYDTIIIDEAHERSLNIDFLLGYLKWLLPKRPDLKLVITSATIDPERFAKHFSDAPIINVSGRSYPVDVRYRPVTLDEEDDETATGEQDAILSAVDELWREQAGDILVFLSGEREIRETAESLRKHHPQGCEVLPLYSRLSQEEQQRVFRPAGRRRVVLATNVAETSLTVPGIRAVIDTGVARISRYSHRTRLQRLPIEKISQASANQRSGRCGRVGPGVAIRLYSEEDFLARPAFTEPEIQRTNLAAVILQMHALKLGDIEAFPFVEPPDGRYVRDGQRTLRELGALSEEGAAHRHWPAARQTTPGSAPWPDADRGGLRALSRRGGDHGVGALGARSARSPRGQTDPGRPEARAAARRAVGLPVAVEAVARIREAARESFPRAPARLVQGKFPLVSAAHRMARRARAGDGSREGRARPEAQRAARAIRVYPPRAACRPLVASGESPRAG